MGSSSSKGKNHQDASKYGDLYLQTDKSTYFAGETVTGHIYLNLLQPYPGTQLCLKLKGKEASHIVKRVKRGDHYYNHKYSEKSETVRETIPVYTFDALMPGQFTIPFSFMIPAKLPPSFYQQGFRYLAYIKYQLEAYIRPNNPTEPKLKYKQSLLIKESIEQPKDEVFVEGNLNVKSCNDCCDQGTTNLKAVFSKNYYAPGETANVVLHVDHSKASLKNQKLVLTLRQRLIMRAEGRALHKDIVRATHEIPGVEGSQPTTCNFSIVIPRPATPMDWTPIDQKEPGKQTLMGLAENSGVITSTTNSSLITSEYYLNIECVMDGCCANLPRLWSNIGIFSPEIVFPVVQAPPGWNPISLGNANVAFNPVQNYSPMQMPMENQMTMPNMVQPQMIQVSAMPSQNPGY